MERAGDWETEPLLKLLADNPPQVHLNAPRGVWGAHSSLLRFLAQELRAGSYTLETGLGLSTAVFAARRTQHTSVFLGEGEKAALLAWCDARGVPTEFLELLAGSSSEVLPRLDPGALDLVLIDGCHAFPFPQLDWYFAASRLREGGVVVVDDVQLPAPWQLARFLSSDPRWVPIEFNDRWAAFRLASAHGFVEEWTQQRFFQPADFRVHQLALQSRKAARRELRALVATAKRALLAGRR